MRRAFTFTLIVCFAGVVAYAQKATIKIVNQSSWAIHHLYLSPVDDNDWGPDQLGDEVIDPKESFTLTGVPADVYDVKLVDEDGDECEVGDVGIGKGKDTWVITSKDLLACQGFGR